MVLYNLSSWKCMKPEFLILSLLILGPTSRGKDIDVYMRPLVDELKELWEDGVETQDAYNNSLFSMRASILWTINDFPAYAMMSGWSTKGYNACPTCNEQTPSVGIQSKIAYIGYRRFLDEDHEWRNKPKLFGGSNDLRPPPKDYLVDDIVDQMENIQIRQPGKHEEYGGVKCKQSPSNLNCIDGKSKDTDKARLDLADMKIRSNLHFYKDGNKWKKPPLSFTLSVGERRQFRYFVKSVKFPDSFVANLSKNVNVLDGKISGLKSHDCHVLFQRSLPAGIRPFLGTEVRKAITELCLFFKQLCSWTVNVKDLKKMQNYIIIILCKLEMTFPLAFFDEMVHLVIHLLKETTLGGPVHFRWMYPLERSMAVYKRYVRSCAHLEGSIAKAYVVNEALTFCSMYFRGTVTLMESWLKRKVEWYILNNYTEIEDYMNEHTNELERESSLNLQHKQEVEFPKWFKTRNNQLQQLTPSEVSDELYALANKNNGFMVLSVDDVTYYGVLDERIEFSYMMGCSIVLLKCNWFDTTRTIEDPIFTSVYVKDECYKADPFILASQAKLLWVELPILDNVQYNRYDVNPTEVRDFNGLGGTTSNNFIVDDDESDEEGLSDSGDDEEHLLVDSDSDDDHDVVDVDDENEDEDDDL
ncbi:uncharacterized protein LOC133785739 [Humulus lupulus]|uniref:uncharacterized protein LOC133785739 n=1 Tax=Humulus lupulus TaxID=3486 RepID=UPI002B40CEAB|nr:uncharacterized protein LOC133785739 [Humulus lupulus]